MASRLLPLDTKTQIFRNIKWYSYIKIKSNVAFPAGGGVGVGGFRAFSRPIFHNSDLSRGLPHGRHKAMFLEHLNDRTGEYGSITCTFKHPCLDFILRTSTCRYYTRWARHVAHLGRNEKYIENFDLKPPREEKLGVDGGIVSNAS